MRLVPARAYKKIVVICPASLKQNWCREIRKWTGDAPNVYMGAEPADYDLIKAVTAPMRWNVINYDIVGRKVDRVKTWTDEKGYKHEENQTRFFWVELINLLKPDLVIVDEGHYIKNMDTNRSIAVRKLKCPQIIFLTGTPVLNRPGELYPMCSMVRPELFPAQETFMRQYTYDGKSARNVEELRQLLRTFMIRRLKKDVLKDLPPINRVRDYTELSAKAKKRYDLVIQGLYEEINLAGNSSNKDVTNILTQIMRLKQVCAIDKVERTAELATELYDQTDESEPRKVIIFSQFLLSAYKITQLLGDEALSFVQRTKSGLHTADVGERDRIVQQFMTDDRYKFLVVTEKTLKEGANVTVAGHVIFNDLFWTPASHEQAEGRAYGRLSDLHSIGSYYRITDMNGEGIDEWIMELLARKLKTIKEVVEGVEEGRDESIVMDLIEKIKASMFKKGK